MALYRPEINVVVPDIARTGSALRRRFAMIRYISTNKGLAGTKLRQSERLLGKLGRATITSSNNELYRNPSYHLDWVNLDVPRTTLQPLPLGIRLMVQSANRNPTRRLPRSLLLLSSTQQQPQYQHYSTR